MTDLYDELNEKFLSSDFAELITFFKSFQNRQDLFEWMRKRPKSEPIVSLVPGDEFAVVVIPTADLESERVSICRDKIYNGISQVYVESHKPIDKFFNYSHNVNVGVKAALRFKPDWIIISNDDMILKDGPKKLMDNLRLHDYNEKNTLFTNPAGDYHSFPRFIGSPTILYNLITHYHPNKYRKIRLNLWKQFGVKYIDAIKKGNIGFLSRLTYRQLKPHLLTGSFTILSRQFVSEQKVLFDETFLNGGEDTDLSLRLYEEPDKLGQIKYSIGDMIGTSLGTGWNRIMRNVVNESYLSYKIEKGLITL